MSEDAILNHTPEDQEDDLSLESEPELEFEDEESQHQESASIIQVDSIIDSDGQMDMAHHSGHSPVETADQQFATGVHQIKAMGNHYLGAKWFRKAGMQGHPKAQFYLGLMFIKGEGVPKSLFHAYCWLSLACCQNFEEAKTARKNLEPYLTAKEMNSALRLAADRIEQIFEH